MTTLRHLLKNFPSNYSQKSLQGHWCHEFNRLNKTSVNPQKFKSLTRRFITLFVKKYNYSKPNFFRNCGDLLDAQLEIAIDPEERTPDNSSPSQKKISPGRKRFQELSHRQKQRKHKELLETVSQEQLQYSFEKTIQQPATAVKDTEQALSTVCRLNFSTRKYHEVLFI